MRIAGTRDRFSGLRHKPAVLKNGVNDMNTTLTIEDKYDLFRDLQSEDPKTREYAMRVLKKNVNSREVVQFLRRLRPNDWEGKISACNLFARIKDDLSIQKLKDLLLDFNPRVRQASEKALKKLGIVKPFTDDEVVELVGFLSHPSWWVKIQAIKSLEALGDGRALEPITRLMLDEDETVQQAAKQAVEALKKTS